MGMKASPHAKLTLLSSLMGKLANQRAGLWKPISSGLCYIIPIVFWLVLGGYLTGTVVIF